ncbi:two component transcriptional regulator, LytTR family [Reichenbachiella faecimaris]|uniref:Two component transcriptional regulator, LytTR family n=1 Tax=Reichenbachiella faecimaris TaxID=692418 RepID=A0A1W2GKR9_REIFA|nr:response regulator [Reichenbachiella faecimaris]SMD36938.1 two component transcriptional regulator, LytTR family [Reichenbachiella faecimaris]
MNKKVLVVEDEALIARDLSFILEDIGIKHIRMAMSYEDALDELKRETFDLILLDINLSSEQDGVDLARHINNTVQTPFIFITSYYNASTVSRAKVTQPLGYLLKPFNANDIRINVEMALYKSDHAKENTAIYLREQSGTIHLELDEIKYLEAQDNYTKIVCQTREIIASQTLKSMLAKLPESNFVRTHKSFAVRVDHISMIKGGFVYIEDDKVPIGRSYKSDFQARIAIL